MKKHRNIPEEAAKPTVCDWDDTAILTTMFARLS